MKEEKNLKKQKCKLKVSKLNILVYYDSNYVQKAMLNNKQKMHLL